METTSAVSFDECFLALHYVPLRLDCIFYFTSSGVESIACHVLKKTCSANEVHIDHVSIVQ